MTKTELVQVMDGGFCGDNARTGWGNATTCPADCAPACGDGDLEGNERCEADVPLADTCESLGFTIRSKVTE